ncbi:MAG: UMP kinase [Kiritimatiellae bacterium]|nr:UMP kinase [Kiritimatiellia bacterium]MDD4734857.1 UMP kinase [Kiritimatiellia bacterium]
MVSEGLKFKRVLLKLSGEVFHAPNGGDCIDPVALNATARQIKRVHDLGADLAMVVGGGNIFRGMPGEMCGIDRTTGDNMGMLATMINSLALQAAIENVGIPTRLMSAIDMPKICEQAIRRRAMRHLEKRRVVIFGAGTGNPYFTTDSAAALRATEIKADVLLKGTKVDGIYTADPKKNPDAVRYDEITYQEALEKRLRIMDASAFSLCQENKVPIIVFNFFKENELMRVLQGEPVGTLVR